MTTPLDQKSTLAEIRARFDRDVDRFSVIETGQSTTIDAPLTMALITRAAVVSTARVARVLDVGCGAGNNTIKLREELGTDFAADLLDISPPMLERAAQRVSAVNGGAVRTIRADFRAAALEENAYDVVLAAAVLHHLRGDDDWEQAFAKLYRIVAPGGSVWITDLVAQETPAMQSLMWDRYGEFLVSLGGAELRDKVFAYVDKEDSPRPVTYQLELLRKVGFAQVELLHKTACFAAFGAIKAPL